MESYTPKLRFSNNRRNAGISDSCYSSDIHMRKKGEINNWNEPHQSENCKATALPRLGFAPTLQCNFVWFQHHKHVLPSLVKNEWTLWLYCGRAYTPTFLNISVPHSRGVKSQTELSAALVWCWGVYTAPTDTVSLWCGILLLLSLSQSVVSMPKHKEDMQQEGKWTWGSDIGTAGRAEKKGFKKEQLTKWRKIQFKLSYTESTKAPRLKNGRVSHRVSVWLDAVAYLQSFWTLCNNNSQQDFKRHFP